MQSFRFMCMLIGLFWATYDIVVLLWYREKFNGATTTWLSYVAMWVHIKYVAYTWNPPTWVVHIFGTLGFIKFLSTSPLLKTQHKSSLLNSISEKGWIEVIPNQIHWVGYRKKLSQVQGAAFNIPLFISILSIGILFILFFDSLN